MVRCKPDLFLSQESRSRAETLPLGSPFSHPREEVARLPCGPVGVRNERYPLTLPRSTGQQLSLDHEEIRYPLGNQEPAG